MCVLYKKTISITESFFFKSTTNAGHWTHVAFFPSHWLHSLIDYLLPGLTHVVCFPTAKRDRTRKWPIKQKYNKFNKF